jgi:hypothetical protein
MFDSAGNTVEASQPEACGDTSLRMSDELGTFVQVEGQGAKAKNAGNSLMH